MLKVIFATFLLTFIAVIAMSFKIFFRKKSTSGNDGISNFSGSCGCGEFGECGCSPKLLE